MKQAFLGFEWMHFYISPECAFVATVMSKSEGGREQPDGSMLVTRITAGNTEYTCNGETTIGMSEYLDQIVDGKPIGI